MSARPSTGRILVAVAAVIVLGAGCDSDDDELSEGDETTAPAAATRPAATPAVTASAPAPATTDAGPVPSSAGEPVGSETTVFEQGNIDQGLQPFIDMAIDDLAGRLGVSPQEITAVSGVLVVWPDASLGCPQPGMQYTQVPVDGSVIELTTGGRVYRYHTGGSRGPFLCDQPLKEVPQTGDFPAD